MDEKGASGFVTENIVPTFHYLELDDAMIDMSYII